MILQEHSKIITENFTVLQVIPQLEIGGAEHVAAFLAYAFSMENKVAIVSFRGGPYQKYLESRKTQYRILESRAERFLRIIKNHIKQYMATIGSSNRENPLLLSVRLPSQASFLTSLIYRFFLIRFNRYLDMHDYQIIQFPTLACAPLFDIAKKYGAAVVYSHHNILSERHGEEDIEYLRSQIGQVDKVVCVSQAAAEDFIATTKISKSRVSVIYNPSFITTGNQVAERFLDTKRYSLLAAGTISNLEGAKGIDILLEAWKIIKQHGLSIPIYVAGGRPQTITYWKARIKEIGLDQEIRLVGRLETETEIIDFYNQIDFLVISSKSEANSLQAIEAMSRGLPIIASDIPALREVIADGGLFFRAGDCHDLAKTVLHFINNPFLTIELGNQARDLWENRYSPQKILQNYYNLYRSIIVQNQS